MKGKRPNPIPIGGAVVANPLDTGQMSPQPQVEIRLEKGLRATKDPRNPYLVKISQVKYPPAKRKAPQVVQPPATMGQAARAAKPAPKAARKPPAHRPPMHRAPGHGPFPGRPGIPPFTPPSKQVRTNPSLFGAEAGGKTLPDLLKIAGVLVGVGFGVPVVRQLLLKAMKKDDVGEGGEVTVLSHAIQTILAAAIFGVAEKKIEDPGLKRATQAIALAVALARPVNQAVEKVKPGSSLKFLGEAPAFTRPLIMDFDVIPPGGNLTSGLGQEVSDLDSDPVLDAILKRRAAQRAPAVPAAAPAVPELPPAEPDISGSALSGSALSGPGLSEPAVAPKGEPLFGDPVPSVRQSPQPPDPSEDLGFPFGSFVDGVN